MSDTGEYASDGEQQIDLTKVLSRYKSTKGAADKRKETSKANMAKARAAKLAGLRQKKEEQASSYDLDYSDDSEDDSDESESDDEELVIRKKKPQKGKGQVEFQENDRLRMMEEAIMMLAQKAQKKSKAKPKKKPVRKTTVIQVGVPQAVPAAANPKVSGLKHNILTF